MIPSARSARSSERMSTGILDLITESAELPGLFANGGGGKVNLRLPAEQNGQLTLWEIWRLRSVMASKSLGKSHQRRRVLGADCRSAAFGCGGSIPSLPTDFLQ